MDILQSYYPQAQKDLIVQYMGQKFEAYIPSNAPVGFHWEPLDASQAKSTGHYGDKVSKSLRGNKGGGGLDESCWRPLLTLLSCRPLLYDLSYI